MVIKYFKYRIESEKQARNSENNYERIYGEIY